MSSDGPAFYDDDAIRATYLRRRARADNPNDTLELPVLWALLGDVTGAQIADLGCGDAAIGRELLARGAAGYTGIEGAAPMADLAVATLTGTRGAVKVGRIEDWRAPPASLDLVLSRLALHYVADLPAVCAQAFAALRPGGRFLFSVEHPVITSCDRGWSAGGPRQDWIVDNYFSQGLRVTHWLGGTVEKYHRTIEAYVSALQGVGFVLSHLREACPDPAQFADPHTYARRMRIPLFLILMGRRPQ